MALSGLLSRILIGFLLWPLAGCLAWALIQPWGGLPWHDPRLLAFVGGAALYALLQALFWKPLFMYVMGHELTHALAAVLQGGRADDMRVSTKGGMVKVNRSNWLVNLAPYFFPIYAFLILLVYWVAQERFRLALTGLLGFSLAFHIALTAYSLREHQSDLADAGWFLALPLIAALNLLILAFVLQQIAPDLFPLNAFGPRAWANLKGLGLWARGQL